MNFWLYYSREQMVGQQNCHHLKQQGSRCMQYKVLKLTRLGLVQLPLTSITHEQIMMQGPRKFCELSRGKEESSLCCFHCFNKLSSSKFNVMHRLLAPDIGQSDWYAGWRCSSKLQPTAYHRHHQYHDQCCRYQTEPTNFSLVLLPFLQTVISENRKCWSDF